MDMVLRSERGFWNGARVMDMAICVAGLPSSRVESVSKPRLDIIQV